MQKWQEMGKKPKKILVWLDEAVYQNFVTLNVGTDIKKTNLNLMMLQWNPALRPPRL